MRTGILRKLIVFICGMCTLFSVALCFAEAPRVGITGFTSKYSGGRIRMVCDTAYTELINALSERNLYQLVERNQLDAIIQEQGLGYTGLIDDATAASWGRLEGVKYMLICNVDFADVYETDAFLFKGRKAKVKLSARLVDVETGMQKKMFRGEDTQSGNPIFEDRYHHQTGGGGSDDNLLAGATRKAVEELLKDMEKAYPLTGKIAGINDKNCIINIGASNGVKEGDRFITVEENGVVRDPDTGEILDANIVEIGSLKIIEVRDRVSVGKMDPEKREFRVGDTVRRKVKD